ncbi:PAS domain S-box-containing protein/diguanylate cyclase (GGDEF) domain-containing protein [Malonomonas rubra DSM 5091]|uniref:PAS domain S-box-containing protein/diguanylate cyclase (GGDEF) domain-containing protein n=1 Tax=Malonomonas rubra DSM 5091 TaxID=1122189 RepID=A0A1M6BHN5_MALRU|nr:EAL domain-containing protein [Malonomonas rubra]SHI48244.1 PAS domain S-box-containing protein/diguanylate cyclase (GGDEF) domain-containing protein [Malonomonas rubra DSM 5091]
MKSTNSEVLVVNEDVATRQAVCRNLGVSLDRVVEAETGLEAIQVLQTVPIRLVVMDADIGEIDGWRLTRLIRSGIYRCESKVPIILVTKNWCERVTRITAREFGINHLLCSDNLSHLPELVESSLVGPMTGLLSPRLLVVEDNIDNAELVKRILRNRFSVELATDGTTGLAAWLEGRHDLVLLDVMLPGISGPEILEAILRIDPKQPVVIMTAHSTMELAQEMVSKGAVDFVSKPFRAEQLRKVCELASCREDYLVSQSQFAARLHELQERTEEYRKVSEEHQRLLDNLSTVILKLDSAGCIVFLSQAWTRLTGYSIESSLGQKLTSYLGPDILLRQSNNLKKLFRLLAGELHQCELEIPLRTSHEDILWLACKLDAISEDDAGLTFFGYLDDISKRKQAQQQLEFLAMHDYLTGVNNRHYFDKVIEQMNASAARDRESHALLYIDLDHFKVVNDTFGHNHGDIVLQDIASLLRSRVRKSDVLCRIGGDEFAVLVHKCAPGHAKKTADLLRALVHGYRYSHAGQQVATSCSIGISEIDGKADTSNDYMKQADMALYVAKRRGRNMVHCYHPEDRESADLRASISWASRFRQALEEDRIFLLFQPVMHIASGSVAYYEALVRLRLPDLGVVSPAAFIPALEESGDMPLLDHWVISRCIELLRQYPSLQQVAINLSAQAFRDEKLVTLVKQLLLQHQVEPQRIIFELTESASMSNVIATQQMIEQLQKIGCSFSLDDFGTGFSTFSYLKQFPAQSVKVDGSFITQVDVSREDQAVVRAITQVASALGKQTVAEYVEEKRVFDMLPKLGIDYAQGYFVGRPIAIEEILQTDEQNCCARL